MDSSIKLENRWNNITRDNTKNVGYWQASWSVTEYDPVNDRYISFWTERTNTNVRYQYVSEITLELNTANPPKAIVDNTSNLYNGANRTYYNNAIYRDPNTNNIGMIYSYDSASNVIQVGATVQNLTEQVIEDLDGTNLQLEMQMIKQVLPPLILILNDLSMLGQLAVILKMSPYGYGHSC